MPVRALLFYVGYTVATVVWGTLGTVFGWLFPYRLRFRLIIGCWTGFCLRWLRWTCGIGYRVEGLEHVPETPCIVLCRHESTWETLFLQQLFSPQATLIKKELLNIPFFGWAFRTLKPIAIDRSQQRKALRPGHCPQHLRAEEPTGGSAAQGEERMAGQICRGRRWQVAH